MLNKFIDSDKITHEHIVVTIHCGRPCILGKAYNEPDSTLSFFLLGTSEGDYTNRALTSGNGYTFGNEHNSIQEIVDAAIDYGSVVKVYEKHEWKQALLWLINNA